MTPTDPRIPHDTPADGDPRTQADARDAHGDGWIPANGDARTPADTRTAADAALRARLAATPLREPAPEQVRRWQAALRELPPPTRHGHWTPAPERPGTWLAMVDPATAGAPWPRVIVWPPEGLGAAAEEPAVNRRTNFEGLSSVGEGLAVIRESAPADRPEAPVHGRTTPPAEPSASSNRRSWKGPGPIRPHNGSTILSSGSEDPSTGAPASANIRIGMGRTPPATANRPLTMAFAEMAVAKIRLATPRSSLAAAMSGLAAAIIAVAVLGPAMAVQRPPDGAPSPSPEGPAATGAGWPEGSAATHVSDAGATNRTNHPTARATDSPATRPTPGPAGQPPTSRPLPDPGAQQPLTLTRDQLRATPPTGHDLGPLADPAMLATCLARFGSTAQPVAARRVVLDGRAGVVLVLPTELPGRLRVLAVDAACTTSLSDDFVGR